MVRLTRSSGRPPAAASAMSRLPSACSNWATMPPPTTSPSRSTPIWPARYTAGPAGAETAWEKPEGRASSSGLMGLIRSTFMTPLYRYCVSLTIVLFPAYDGGMRIAVLGGGPGGLYFAALAKQLDARHDITVWERNAADDTFGFGVVFSDETLGGIEHADLEIFSAMAREFARWDDIDVHFRGATFTSGGHGFAAMSRKRLLAILQARCASLGVQVHFRAEAPDVAALAASHDLVVAADGMNSATRARFAPVFGPALERRRCKYIWLGTDLVFDAFKFYILDTPAGVMQVHGYPYSEGASTFILEMHEDVWRRAGFGDVAASGLAPGQSDEASIELIRGLCADVLGGPSGGQHSLVANNSRWTAFTTVRCQTWRHGNVVLLGDAAHTAHFSIGSGTKLAMEDALALAACLHEQDGVSDALAAYEAERRPVVSSTQRAAQASLEWFENIGQYADQDPHQFAFNIVTRSRRVTYDNLRLRDPEFVADMDRWFAGGVAGPADPRPPMFQPFRLGGLELANRVIVSAARAAARAGFDLLELHCAHGYLLSEFLSPLTNRRTDRYGGSAAARLRYPLEVFDAIRAVWPQDRPMTVRISATDWCEGGLGIDDTVEIARAFAEHGVAGIDVSTGQVVSEEKPAFGRSYQTPYADRIRNEIGCKYGVAVIAVGAISSYDDVNSLILAGRADLCALGRTHLYDPQWTLHAAAEQGYAGPGADWPLPFAAGSRRPQSGRTDGPRPRLDLIRAGTPGVAHARWRPSGR